MKKNFKKKAITIAFEGGEGSGKGTSIFKLIRYFLAEDLDYIILREPGGMRISEQIRDFILDEENTNMNGLTEAYLYAASRAQLLHDCQEEFVKKDIIVFDRSIYSSMAYQGFARGLGLETIKDINSALPDYIDYVVYLQLDPEIGINRIMSNRQDEVNRLDLEELSFHKKVREGYDTLSKMYPEKFIIINANQDKDKVFLDIIKALKEKEII